MASTDQSAEPKVPSNLLWTTLGTFVLGLPILFIAAGMVYDYVRSKPPEMEAGQPPQPASVDPQKNIKDELQRLGDSVSTDTPSDASTTDVK